MNSSDTKSTSRKNKSKNQTKIKGINYYDHHKYDKFWVGRDYEHLSEVAAIKHLLAGSKFKKGLDYGGAYGRLVPTLSEFTEELILSDPSGEQLDFSRKYLKDFKFSTLLLTEDAHIPVKAESLDLLVMVRVSHHLVDPTKNFEEIYRVLKPGGKAVIEIANSAHFFNRVKWAAKLKTVPKTPIKVGQYSNGIVDDIPFVNHNPETIFKELNDANLKVVEILSVSNLRSRLIKQVIPLNKMISIESRLQTKLAGMKFGPSIFVLVQK